MKPGKNYRDKGPLWQPKPPVQTRPEIETRAMLQAANETCAKALAEYFKGGDDKCE